MTLLVVVRILPLPTLKILNIEFRLLLDAWLVGVGTDDNALAVNQLGPWVGPTASKTVRSITTLDISTGGRVAAVLLESLLSNTRISWAWGEVELLATQLLGTNDVANICDVVFGFDECVQHVDENRPLSDHSLRASITVGGVV